VAQKQREAPPKLRAEAAAEPWEKLPEKNHGFRTRLQSSFCTFATRTKTFLRGKTSAFLHRGDFVSRYPPGVCGNRPVQKCRSFAKSRVGYLAKPSVAGFTIAGFSCQRTRANRSLPSLILQYRPWEFSCYFWPHAFGHLRNPEWQVNSRRATPRRSVSGVLSSARRSSPTIWVVLCCLCAIILPQ